MTDPQTGLFPEAADDELLQQLTEALRPPPLTPSPASMEALRRAVEQKWRPAGRGRVMGQLTAWARRLQRSGAAMAVLGGVVVGGTGVALAANRSIPPPVKYTLHNLGIPVLSRDADHHGDRHPATSSVKAGPEASPPTSPRGEPLTARATFQVLLAPARSTLAPARLTADHAAPVAATMWRRSWSAPAPSAPHASYVESWRAAPVGRHVCAWTGRSRAGTTTPVTPRATNLTRWSRPVPTNSWSPGPSGSPPSTGGFTNGGGAPPATRTGAGWSPPSTGGSTIGSGIPMATRASFGPPPYQATKQTDAAFAAPRRDGPPGYGGRW